MKRRLASGSTLLALTLFALGRGHLVQGSAQPVRSSRQTVTLALTDYATQMRTLSEAGYDIAGASPRRAEADVVVTDAELAQLEARGFRVARAQREAARGPDARYQTPEKIRAALEDLAKRYPQLARLGTVGKSLEGRDILSLVITRGAGTHDPRKPVFLFNGMHHARELMTSEVVLDIADRLLSGYGKDARVTHWVDANEIHLIPMLNVDGNRKVWDQDKLWRKNARGGYGVDINRNYPYAWNSCKGSSGFKLSQQYRGPGPASEPETQAMMDFVGRIRPVFDISFHSYSELVIYPYGCDNQRAETREIVEGIGQEMARALPSDTGEGDYEAGTSWETLYSVDGGDIDWMYHEYGVIPYVIEMNSGSQGFQPDFDQWRQPTVEKLRAAWSLLLDRVDGSGIRGVVTLKGPAGSRPAADAVVTVKRTSAGEAFSGTYRVAPDGSYHAVVLPGTYELAVDSPGFERRTSSVTVGPTRVQLDAELTSR